MAVKTVQGVAEASVKTVLGVANASVKTIMGVTMTGGGGGIALVASVSSATDTSGTTSAGINTTGANLIVIHVSSYSSAAAPTISDSNTNTWTALTEYNAGDAVSRGRLYYCYSPVVGSGHTFTSSGGTSYSSISVLAFSGTTGSSADTSNGAGSPTVSTKQPGSITPSGNNMVVVTGLNFNSGSPASIDSPFTLQTQVAPTGSNNFGAAIAYEIQTTAAARNPTWTIGSATDGMVTEIAAFA